MSESPQPYEPEPRPPATSEQLVAEAWYLWLGHVGTDNAATAEQTFSTKYLGLYDSFEQFARDRMTSDGIYQVLDELHHVLPESLTKHVTFSEEAYMAEMAERYYVAPSQYEGVHVFEDSD